MFAGQRVDSLKVVSFRTVRLPSVCKCVTCLSVFFFFEVLGVQRVCCVRVGHVALERRSIWFGWAAGRVFPSVCHRHRFMRALFTITKVCVRVCCVSLAHLVLNCGEKHTV